MEAEPQSLQEGAVNREGRRRLRLLLAGLGAATCAVAMALVLVFYGTPYESFWWPVMGAVLVAAAIVSALCAPAVEWVIAGYLRNPH